MSKNIDINNEEEILKECDFDYFYNSENCSRELCAFYNDIWRNGNDENFDKNQALIDLGRIGIVLNNQRQQIAELKAENEELKAYKKGAYEKYVSKCAYLQQQLKDNTKQVCEKIKKWGNKHFNWVGDGTGYDGQDYNEMIGFNNAITKLFEVLDQIENEKEEYSVGFEFIPDEEKKNRKLAELLADRYFEGLKVDEKNHEIIIKGLVWWLEEMSDKELKDWKSIRRSKWMILMK